MALRPITPDSANRMTCLIIGQAGAGKTSLLRTIPETEKVLVLSAEGGLLCVRDLVTRGQIEGFEIGSIAEFKEALEALRGPEYTERYQWIFIDSLSEISSRCVERCQKMYPDKKDSFSLWDTYQDTMTSLIKAFRDLKAYSVVFTCLETVEQDEAKRRFIGPDIAGKQLKKRLTSYFDEVFYMTIQGSEIEEPQRVFYTQPFDLKPGKDRSGVLAPVEHPDLGYIKNKILGKGD